MIDHILNKKPHDGLVDEFKDIRLRIGIIDNPSFFRKGEKIEPLNPVGSVNVSNGQVCVKWIDEQGGIIRSDIFKGQQEIKESGIVDEHMKVTNVKKDNSNKEMITLTHPMIWANDINWCGMHYLPPVGSIVIVGFKRHGFPVLLGYLQSNYKICNPIKLGEIMMKGYGKNYIHWKQSARLEAKVWARITETDLDSPGFSKKNDVTCTINMKFDAHDKFMHFQINAAEPILNTQMTLRPDSFTVVSSKASVATTMTVTPTTFDVDTKDFTVKASSITLDGNTNVKGTPLTPVRDTF